MTTLDNRPNSALLVVDVQKGVVADAHNRDAVVANVSRLVDQARAQHVAIVWVQDSLEGSTGSDEWQIVPELSPTEAEPLVHKDYGDSFEATELESVLSGLGIGRLIVVGALARGYDATLVSDAHTTEDLREWGAPPPEQVISHTNMYWGVQTAPGRTAGTVETADVSFTG
jgi:nicotinamidase-related amidase